MYKYLYISTAGLPRTRISIDIYKYCQISMNISKYLPPGCLLLERGAIGEIQAKYEGKYKRNLGQMYKLNS